MKLKISNISLYFFFTHLFACSYFQYANTILARKSSYMRGRDESNAISWRKPHLTKHINCICACAKRNLFKLREESTKNYFLWKLYSTPHTNTVCAMREHLIIGCCFFRMCFPGAHYISLCVRNVQTYVRELQPVVLLHTTIILCAHPLKIVCGSCCSYIAWWCAMVPGAQRKGLTVATAAAPLPHSHLPHTEQNDDGGALRLI